MLKAESNMHAKAVQQWPRGLHNGPDLRGQRQFEAG